MEIYCFKNYEGAGSKNNPVSIVLGLWPVNFDIGSVYRNIIANCFLHHTTAPDSS